MLSNSERHAYMWDKETCVVIRGSADLRERHVLKLRLTRRMSEAVLSTDMRINANMRNDLSGSQWSVTNIDVGSPMLITCAFVRYIGLNIPNNKTTFLRSVLNTVKQKYFTSSKGLCKL